VLAVVDRGRSQLFQKEIKFFENGQPTRTGPDAAMYPDSPTRQKIDLAGEWRYSLNGKEWTNVTVPSSYSGEGKVTFVRSFTISPDMLDAYSFSLVVYGINYMSEISINGNFTGRHMGGYSSFVVPIPSNTLQIGTENNIRIQVDNELSPKTTLPLRQQVGGWKSYGGIFRDIYILATPRLAIENVEITYDPPKEDKPVRLTVRSEVMDHGYQSSNAPLESFGYQVEVFDKLDGSSVGKSPVVPIVHQQNKSGNVTTEVSIPEPKLWSPSSPDLYVLKASIVKIVAKTPSLYDEYDMNFGVRDLQWMNGRLFVNGNLEPLKGIVWYEDHPLYGSALTYEAIEKDITQIKTLGANVIRFLSPPHPYVLNLCDRYGLLVLEEIPMRNVPEEILGKDYFQDLAVTYAKEMAGRDREHPSVLAWGIGDGIEATSSSSCDDVATIRNAVKSLDKRPVYFASQSAQHPCFSGVDLVGWDCLSGDIKVFRELLKHWKGKFPDKPLIVLRYGRMVEPGNRGGYSDPLSMEAQARTAMLFHEAIAESKIAGGVFWSYNDWSSDRPSMTTHSHDPYLISMGVVSADREKRTSFDVLRAMYNGEKVQALPVGNFASNAPVIYVVSGIIALISFFFLYNGNRRFRDCVNRSLFRTYNFFADVRDQRIITYLHTVTLGLILSVTWATLLSSIFYHYRDNLTLDNLLSQLLSDPSKEWLVRLIWHPMNFILVISVIAFVLFGLVSIIVRLGSLFVRTHVYFYHAISITVWSALPYVLLIPVAMVVYRLSMETEFYINPMLILIVILTVWTAIRLLKGISIIYDVVPVKIYAVSLFLVIIAGTALYSYLDYTLSMSMYMRFILESLQHPA
jgi:hypothetical protein